MEITLLERSQWSGIVKIDASLDDYVTNIEETQDSKRFVIKDVKYHHENYLTPDLPPNFKVYSFPREVTIWMKKQVELQNYMRCDALLGFFNEEKIRGFIRKEKYYEERLVAKGFKLGLVDTHDEKVPVLASYRAGIGADNAINIEQKGIICFCSASQSSSDDAAYQSLTCVFIASDEKPFVAYVRKKGSMNKVICDSNSIREISQDKEHELKNRLVKPSEDPLTVLKLRLAKGEITKEEYEDLQKMIRE